MSPLALLSPEPFKSIGQASSIILEKMASVGYRGLEIPFICANNFANPVYVLSIG
jgi:hypothetical protein